MELLIDPNICYLLLVSGLVLLTLSLFAPGTGLLEIGALFTLVLSGFGIYNLPVNLWALGLLLAGLVFFYLSLRRQPKWIYLSGSMILFIGGSIFLFQMDNGSNGVHPVLASVISICAIGLLWWAGSKSLDAIQRQPEHSLERLIGMSGKAHSDIESEGTAYVNGEEWTARSDELIPEGSTIRVIRREGFVLIVELVSPPPSNSD